MNGQWIGLNNPVDLNNCIGRMATPLLFAGPHALLIIGLKDEIESEEIVFIRCEGCSDIKIKRNWRVSDAMRVSIAHDSAIEIADVDADILVRCKNAAMLTLAEAVIFASEDPLLLRVIRSYSKQ